MEKPKKGRGKIVKFSGNQAAEEAAKSFRDRLCEVMEKIQANPNADGWRRLCEILDSTSEDARVCSSAGASSFVDLMREIAADSFTASSAEEALGPLITIIKSSNATDMVTKRFANARKAEKWVVSEWLKYKTDYRGNKSEFARIYVKRILNELDVKVTERNMISRWLKGL